MDKIESACGVYVIKDQILNDSGLQKYPEAASMVVDGLPEEGYGRPHEWMRQQIPTSPAEHPRVPDFNPDFNKMNQEFRNKIRRRQQEEWD